MLRLVMDGTENVDCRGLMAISALTIIAASLRDVPIVVWVGDDPAVHTAVHALRWDTGLQISTASTHTDPDEILHGASLFGTSKLSCPDIEARDQIKPEDDTIIGNLVEMM
jgi:hypothetical protein